MKTYKTLNLLFVAGFAVLLTSSVAGQALGASNDGLGPDQASTAGTGTAGSATPSGGAIQGLNLTSEATAEDWAGLYGQIETSRVLQDASSNTFYEWEASEPDNMEFVYATLDGTTPQSSNIEVANDVDALTGISAGAEAASNTFNESKSFSGLGASLSGADVAETQSSSGTLDTYLLNGTSTNSPVYAAEAGNLNAFDGDSVNYQMLLGGGSQYDFYVEL